MVITPKKYSGQYPFVDREGYVQTFKESVYNIRQKKFSILVYYGVAGIGKTSLRKEFPKYLEEHNLEYQYRKTIWASIDLHLEKYREKNTFLVTLKNELQKKYKINFTAFEIAHAIYWKKVNPEIPLKKENYMFFEGDENLDSFFGVVDQIPYFSLVPAAARLIKSSHGYIRKWWKKIGESELNQLFDKEPLEIEEMLPYFWAQDLNNYLENTSQSAVFFIDTYEALWENHRSDGHCRDEWIREELIPRLPRKLLWVICGRESLKWEETDKEWSEYLSQYEVEKLLKDYCIEYLENREITTKEIQEAIFKGSKGIPYYLELSAHTYERIVEIREPKPEDFGDNYQKITDKFFRFLSSEEKSTLNVLSVPRFWDYKLFEYLVREFNTGYSTNNYEDLCSFSFISKAENKRYQMHQLMQESLQKTQNTDSVLRILKAIHEYYSNKTKDILNAVLKKYDACLSPKTRVADALRITNSGLSSNEYSYALKAHFDFVVCKEDSTSEFAVEFDELRHPYDKSTIYEDELNKNNICCKLEFPLLRITSEYLEKIGKFPSILSWITELYFLQKRFYVAQEKGDVPLDEPWLWFNVVGYDPFVRFKVFIQKAYDKGLCSDSMTECISGSYNDKKSYATLAVLKIRDNEYIASLVECSAINFYAIPPRAISTEIAEYNVAKKLGKYIEGNNSIISTYPEILEMRKDFVKKYNTFPYSINLDG